MLFMAIRVWCTDTLSWRAQTTYREFAINMYNSEYGVPIRFHGAHNPLTESLFSICTTPSMVYLYAFMARTNHLPRVCSQYGQLRVLTTLYIRKDVNYERN